MPNLTVDKPKWRRNFKASGINLRAKCLRNDR